jgi:hypothetical protein
MPPSNGFHISPCKTAFLPHEHFTVWSVGIDSSRTLWYISLRIIGLCFAVALCNCYDLISESLYNSRKTVWLERKQSSVSERLKERRNGGLLWCFVLIYKFMIPISEIFQVIVITVY